MASNLARPGTQKAIPVAEAKTRVIDLIQGGHSVKSACQLVSRSEETYRDWRKSDPEFKYAIDSIRSARADEREGGRALVPGFEEFCDVWLHQPLFPHQLRMFDVIEGRPPRDMHESMSFDQGYRNRILINVPPDHGKSTTFTVNYVVWRIHRDPDVRVVIVSKGTKLAADFLYEIKIKLTSPQFREMHLRFAPEGGWKDPDGSWTGDRIYVQGKNTAGVQKDPTVQAMGIKGQIYGRRCDLIILDDIIDSDNVRESSTQLRKINRDISSRLPPDADGTDNTGQLIVLGTRVAPMDIYRVLCDQEDGDDRRVWSYLRQPAVLDYGDGDSKSWTTLWPWRWSGPQLSRRRVDSSWNLFFQQLDVADDMTFKAEAVSASINGLRFPGPMTDDGKGHRPGGMTGLYVVIGLDPAASGNTAMVVAGVDRESKKRWVIDGWNKPNATASDIISKFKDFTDMYRPNEWLVEKNAFQRFLTQLPDIVDYARARGVRITPHYTTANKFDVDWGVQTMGPLFDSCVEWDAERKAWKRTGKGLIELPSTRQNAWVNELVQQLTVWQPEGMAQKVKTDLVMALWFTHIAISAQLYSKKSKATHMYSPFTSPGARSRQTVVDLAAIRQQRRELEAV